jgi:hypothetical protein
MDWITLLFIVSVLLAIIAGVYKVSQSPVWWAGLLLAGFRAGWPVAVKAFWKLVARHPKDIEDKKNACLRSGGKWNNIKKRCE